MYDFTSGSGVGCVYQGPSVVVSKVSVVVDLVVVVLVVVVLVVVIFVVVGLMVVGFVTVTRGVSVALCVSTVALGVASTTPALSTTTIKF